MSADALARLEAFLEAAHPGFASDRALHEEARALSRAYTEDTGAAPAADAAGSIAYLAHFGPRAIAAVSYALAFVPPGALGTCVDVGAGSGASALALFAAGAQRVTLVERSARALDVARRLLAGKDARFVAGDVGAGEARQRAADLVLSAFSFGELSAREDEDEVRAAFGKLEKAAPGASTFVLVDAGDRERARRLQRLRDVFARDGTRAIAAPCPHSDACPALARDRDWCHTRIAKGLPEKLARFAREVGRDDEAMALSFLVLTKAAPREVPADGGGGGVLVIGDPHREKGRARLPVCGPAGLRFVQVLKRHRAAHDALLASERGAHLPAAVAQAKRNDAGDTALVDDTALLG